MKAASAELRGVRCLEYAQVDGLRFPLFALIHYNGYALIAQSVVRSSFTSTYISIKYMLIAVVLYILSF